MTDCEILMNILDGHIRSVYNFNSTLKKDTSNGDKFIIMLSKSIKM